MRALVISGGGSKGAFAGGVAEHLIRDKGIDYDIYVGTSTGSLLVPFLAAEEIDHIRDIYTTVRQEDIFNVNPLKIRKINGKVKATFHHLAIFLQFLKRRKTFGESQNLRKLIERSLSREVFQRLKESSKYIIATVANLSLNIVEHKYLRDCTYEDYCDWVWISANMVPFMSLVNKNGYEYADGGFGNLVPVQEAINLGAKEIDVIVLNPRHMVRRNPDASNAVNLLMKAFNFMLYQIAQDDIKMSLMESRYSDLKVRLIHTPRILTENAIVFHPEEMQDWWKEGRLYAQTLLAGE